MKGCGNIAKRVTDLRADGRHDEAQGVLNCESETLAQQAAMSSAHVKEMVGYCLRTSDCRS